VVTVLALGAALLYGSADFLGGAATRRAPVLSVVVISSGAGLIVLLAAAVIASTPLRTGGMGWGIAAGAAGGAGLIVFYRGLAAGPMSVVAPVSALFSTVLPVGVALAEGERPGAVVYAGAALCLAAIVLVSSGGPARPASRGWPARALAVGYGISSGAFFGAFFLFIRYSGQAGSLWPLAGARLAGLFVILAAAASARAAPMSWRDGGGPFLAALAAGVLDASANVLYVIATRAGLFGLAVVLVSLYPGITVLLARMVLGERLRWPQRLGLAVAALGVALVTI
jgi:drug/metabolite transporter (DMT)-like permease